MDLLGSILNSMDKPPAASEQQKALKRKHNEQLTQMKNKEQEELNRFRKYCQERIDRINKDPNRASAQFAPMDRIYRSVVYDVAEAAGMIGMCFGQDGVDRYIIVYKRDQAPSEDEIEMRRDGEEWNPEKAKEYAEKKKIQQQQQKQIENTKESSITKIMVPNSNYRDKYAHLIGSDADPPEETARKTETNKSYGIVPSENKKDLRSIEQTMADIRAKKKLKLTNSST